MLMIRNAEFPHNQTGSYPSHICIMLDSSEGREDSISIRMHGDGYYIETLAWTSFNEGMVMLTLAFAHESNISTTVSGNSS